MGAEAFRPLIVAYRKGAAVRLSDVASVEDRVEDLRSWGLANGKPAVILIIFRALDRNNRSLEKVKRFSDKVRDGLAAVVEEKTAERVVVIFTKEFPANKFVVDSTTEIGPTIGKKLQEDALIAVLVSFAGIILYIAARFEFRFGIAAALATFHDVLAVLGAFSFFAIAGIYYMVPRMWNTKLHSDGLANWSFWMMMLGGLGFYNVDVGGSSESKQLEQCGPSGKCRQR